MQVFEFVIAIVALSLLYKLVDSWVRRRSQAAPRHEDAERAALERRLDAVEERVRVLERIVTDERYDLKQQFKDLGS